jgi:hypothetical protein
MGMCRYMESWDLQPIYADAYCRKSHCTSLSLRVRTLILSFSDPSYWPMLSGWQRQNRIREGCGVRQLDCNAFHRIPSWTCVHDTTGGGSTNQFQQHSPYIRKIVLTHIKMNNSMHADASPSKEHGHASSPTQISIRQVDRFSEKQGNLHQNRSQIVTKAHLLGYATQQ